MNSTATANPVLTNTILIDFLILILTLAPLFIGLNWALKRRKPKTEAERKKSVGELRESLEPQKQSNQDQVELEGTNAGFESLEEFPIGKHLQVELTKVKGHQRIVIVRGRVKVRPSGIIPTSTDKLFFFTYQKRNYYIKPNKIIKVEVTQMFSRAKTKTIYKLVYDILFSEPLGQDGKVQWDEEIEMLLVDSAMDQYIAAATMEAGFQLTPATVKLLVLVSILMAFFGLALNGTLHLTPPTVVHWLPR